MDMLATIASSRRRFVGLLDLYPGAAAAYSLRALRASWLASAVVRVRRSSDNAESDFTAAQITDGTLTTWTGAGNGFVVTWYDQSGNTRNATQSTAANQPRIVNAGVLETGETGKPCVRFIDASGGAIGHYLAAAPYYAVDAQNVQAFSAYELAASGNFPIIEDADFNRGFLSAHNGISRSVRTATLRTGGNSVADGAALTLAQQYLRYDYADRTRVKTFLNGSGTATVNVADRNENFMSFTSVWIGNVNSAFAQSDIKKTELIRYTLTTTGEHPSRAGIEANINAYLGIY